MIQEFLSQFSTKQATELLTEAAFATSPIPEIEGKPSPSPLSERVIDLLAAVREQLRIPPGDLDAEAKQKVDRLIGSTLRQRMLEGVDRKKVLERAGQAGRLKPADYIVAQPQGMAVFNVLAVRPNHIIDTIQHPDRLQHVMNEKADKDNKEAISLFVKFVSSKHVSRSFYLLVQTQRSGLTQIAQAAWRIYPTQVDVSDVLRPVDMLAKFVTKFGLPFLVNGVQTTFVAETEYDSEQKISLDFPQGEGLFWSATKVGTSHHSSYQLGLIYCINLEAYRLGLIEAGNKIEPLPTAKHGAVTNTAFPLRAVGNQMNFFPAMS